MITLNEKEERDFQHLLLNLYSDHVRFLFYRFFFSACQEQNSRRRVTKNLNFDEILNTF